MELLQLRYFLTTAEYQHMTKAAEHLQIAQPALSQAIHRLESELGIPLFERKNRSIELNDAGRLLQKRLIPEAAGSFHPDYQPDHSIPYPAAGCELPAVPVRYQCGL